eukprot:m.113383 g.113383  ORF g.113383 m.113383 type:complete len:552 (-) comp15998_c0_seq1:208-1863(-)
MSDWDHSENFYSILNVSREATDEELKNAYRRMCVMYHPDKHHDEASKKEAERLFAKIHSAYSTLIDPHRRVLYNLHGAKAFTSGVELAPYYTTLAEMKADFEMKKKLMEEERQMAIANAQVKMIAEVDATALLREKEYEGDSTLYSLLMDVELTALSVSQSIETPLTERSSLGVSGALVSKNGRGSGNCTMTLSHRHSDSTQMEATVGFGGGRTVMLKLTRSLAAGIVAIFDATAQEVDMGNAIGIGFGCSAALYRNLGTHAFGLLKWQVGMDSHMATRVHYARENFNVSGAIKLGEQNDSIGVTVKRNITDSTIATGSIGMDLDEVRFAIGISHELASKTSFGISLRLGLSSGVTVRFRYSRRQQEYTVPVRVSEALTVESIVWASIVPVALYVAVRKFIILPYYQAEEKSRLAEQRRKNMVVVAEKKREALAAVRLMQQAVARKVEAEKRVNGLVITSALYGRLVASNTSDDANVEPPVDVTIPLQCLVKDSQLRLHASSKASIVGFYDPCPDEPKQLRVRYEFKGNLHEVTIDDHEELKIPLRKHALA